MTDQAPRVITIPAKPELAKDSGGRRHILHRVGEGVGLRGGCNGYAVGEFDVVQHLDWDGGILRRTVAQLAGGVIPPGIQRTVRRDRRCIIVSCADGGHVVQYLHRDKGTIRRTVTQLAEVVVPQVYSAPSIVIATVYSAPTLTSAKLSRIPG